jgi:hypothetical protein
MNVPGQNGNVRICMWNFYFTKFQVQVGKNV